MCQGLRQGDVLSTLLFIVVLEAIVRRPILQTIGTFSKKQTQLLTYANDVDIVGKSLEAERTAHLALEAEAAKVRLKINEQKTKYMIAAGNRTIFDAGQTVAFGDKNFEIVCKFVTPKNDNLEIPRRIQPAKRCF
jgi:hypothetical protein